MAEAIRQGGARPRPALSGFVLSVLALLPLALATGAPAGGSTSVSLTAHINGTNAATSTQQQPVNLSSNSPADVQVIVANRSGSRVVIRTVRVDGTVLGLTFFSYDTQVDLLVHAHSSLRFALDTSGLAGQAVGLIPGSVDLLDGQHDTVASVSMVTDVHGSIVSVYGLFGLALLILTILAFADVLLAMARHRMSPNRWRRALRFLTPGIGFGLVLVFTLSALAVWVPSPGTWLVTVVICAAVFFVLGYLSPTPRGPEDEDEEDEDASEFLVPAAAAPEGGPVVSLDEQAVIDALPNYEIGGELGRGGWGVVLAGKHRQLGRDVAIKQLPRAFAADETIRGRFTVEARLLASLDHPHIVPVYDFVEQDGLCLLVMELLPGGTVWSRFTADGFTASGATAVVLACLSGLQAADGRRVLHRDIKPENLMFSSTGALKVTDFGIAKVVGGEDTMATRAGEVVGTPAYIAPEQARGGELSPATDVYAVATMLYELLCGALPFVDDGDAMALMFKHAFEPPEPLLEKAPNLPEGVAAVVMSGLATDPGERPDSAEHFGVALAEACTAAWGPGWLPTDGTPVMGANSIVAATERPSGPPAGPTLETTPLAAEAGPAPATVPRAAAAAGAPATVAKPPTTPVRPTVTVHTRSAALADVAEGSADLVPLKEVLTPPPSPAPLFAVAALLGVVALVLALVGLGAPSSGGTLAAGQVRVAGTDVVSGGTVTVNLSKPVPVTVSSAAAPTADHVQLSVNVLGQDVSSATAPLVTTAAGRGATVSLGGRYLVGGSFTGKVTLWHGLVADGDATFAAHTSQTGLLSVPAGITLVLLLLTIGYAESLLRSLRRGKSTKTAPVGLAFIGAVFGIALVGVGWVLARQVPTATSLIICAVLGAAAGVALALGGIRVGRMRRFRRIVRREERQAAQAAQAA